MSHEEKVDPDGIRNDGVPYYAASPQELKSYAEAREALSLLEVPVLFHTNNPHEYLYVAAFDGTGNDKFKDPDHETNIAAIDDQIGKLTGRIGDHVKAGYVPGPGTEDNTVARLLDGAQGYTYDQRIEQMYKLFIEQAKRWRNTDPQAEIRVAGIGFSRGGEQEAGFARLLQERGIQDPAGAIYTYDRHHRITHVTYTRPPLVAPGHVAQAVGLLDPVGTGAPERDYDRRLPPSVISGFQIIAANERRYYFKSDHIIDPGMTPDERFLAVTVAGAHCDIGGSYNRDGLSIRSGDLLVDYVNALADKPFLERQIVTRDPRLDVIHRSEDGMLLYRITPKVNRANPNGYNELLVPRNEMKQVADPFNAEPVDASLSRQFDRHRVATDLPSTDTREAQQAPAHVLSSGLDRLLAAGQADDWKTFDRESHLMAFGNAGRDMLVRANAQVDWQEQRALEQAAQQQAMQQQPMQRSAPAMHH